METWTEELFWFMYFSRCTRVRKEEAQAEKRREEYRREYSSSNGREEEPEPEEPKEVSLEELSKMTGAVKFFGS